MKFRARSSSIADILGGVDGLTPAQEKKLTELLDRQELSITDSKKDLTDNMKAELADLIDKRDNIKITQGTKTAVEKMVQQTVYEYVPNRMSNKQTLKGTNNEDTGVEFYNRVHFTNHSKLVEQDDDYELTDDISTGHPDITCHIDKKVIDIKLSYTKETFPKTIEEARNSVYEWQVKDYLRKMIVKTGDDSWRHGEIAFILVSTPEEDVPPWEEPSLHYVDHLEDHLRYTIVPVYLSDEDIKHIERRAELAQQYASEYYNVLINKNK